MVTQWMTDGECRVFEVVSRVVLHANGLHDLCDGRLSTAVNATTSSSANWSKAQRRAVHAASLAYPRPQCSRARRQPISMAGVNGASNPTTPSPVKPMKAPVSLRSRAHKPKPCSAKCPAHDRSGQRFPDGSGAPGNNASPAGLRTWRQIPASHHRATAATAAVRFPVPVSAPSSLPFHAPESTSLVGSVTQSSLKTPCRCH